MRPLPLPALLAVLPLVWTSTLAAKAPNIVLIYSDDQGWGDVGYHGCDDILTPNIDKLAAQGTQFTQGYVCASVCGPSRCGLLTGVYQQRLGVYGNWDQGGIPASQPTIFELLKPHGYQTAAIGKWHVGAAREELRPNNRDVDFFYGFLWGAHDYYRSSTDPDTKKKGERPIMRNTSIEPPIQDSNGYLTEMFTKEAVDFIDRADADKPFFVYLAYNAVHHPWDVPQPYIDRVRGLDTHDERKLFAGMVLCLDDGVGAVMKAIERKGVTDDTLVVFMSDNGTPRGQGIAEPKQKTRGQCTMSNPGPFNGFKGDTYEGGIRVPMVMHWPGKIPAGKKYEQPVINLDLAATFAALNGISKPDKGLPFDGVNLMPWLTGELQGRPHETLYWRRGDDYAVRKGDWKLAFNDQGSPGRIELFNLAHDPGEWKDLSAAHPERAQQFQDLFDAWDSALPDNQTGKNPKNRNSGYASGKRVNVAAHNAGIEPATPPSDTSTAPRPNIILMMTDDMGYECLSCNGSLDYQTPVLDGLAEQGLRFEHCYSLPICTPSRVQLMTGRYSYRNYERFGLLPPSEITFGKQLKDAGYRTAMVGKWQLGGDWQSPLKFGFDEYCLQNGINPKEKFDRSIRGPSRYWGYPAMVANGELYESRHTYGPDMLNEYAVNFIKKDSDKPFFLYYPMLLTHSPFEPSPDIPGEEDKDGRTSEVRYFKSMVEYTDKLVGNIVRALEESGKRENTLILFTGDNGTTYPVKVTASNPQMRRIATATGRVGTLHEAGRESPKSDKGGYIEGPVTRTTYGDVPGGKDLMKNSGTHVPLVVSWPKHAAAYAKHGHTVGDLVDFSDFFTTFIDLAGAEPPTDREIDGISFANRLTGKGASSREYVLCHYWHFGRDPKRARDAIHDGTWRLYSDGSFFHIAGDLDETKPIDLKTASPEAVAAHQRLLKQYETLRGFSIPNDAPNNMFPGANAPKPKGITLDQQLEHAKVRARNKGIKFDPARTTRWFNAKDLNKDGVLDEKEQKTKAPNDWNKR